MPKSRAAAVGATALGVLSLVAAGLLAYGVRERAAAADAAWGQALAVSSGLERLAAALKESDQAAGKELTGDAEARAQGDAAARATLEMRGLDRLVPAGSQVEAARARLELLVNEKLAVDVEALKLHRGEAVARRSAPELARLIGERIRGTIEELDRQMRLSTDTQLSEIRSGLHRDLAWLLASLLASLLALLVGGFASLRAPSVAPDRAVYLTPGEPPAVAPPMLQDVLDTMSDGVLVVDAHGKLIASSPPAASILDLEGRVPGPKRRGPRGLYLPSEDSPASTARNPLVRAMAGERVEGVEMSVGRPSDPESRRIVLSARPFRDPDGTRKGAAVILRDVTDLRKAEGELLRVEAERVRALAERGPDITEPPAADEEESLRAEIRKAEKERARAEVERQRAEADRDRADAERQAAESDRRAVEAERLRADADRTKAELDHRRTAATLRRSEERLVRLFEGLPVPLVALGPEARVRRANQAAAELLGITPGDLTGSSMDGRWEAVDSDGARKRLLTGPAAGTILRIGTATVPDLVEGASVQVIAFFPEGREAPVSSAEPVAVGTASTLPPTDTEWEARADLLRQVLQGLPTGVLLVGPDGQIHFANDLGRRLWPAGEAQAPSEGQPRWVDSGEPLADAEWGAAAVRAGATVFADRAIQFVDAEGRTRTVRPSLVPLLGEDGAATLVVLDDVSEEQRLGEERRQLRGRSAALVDKLRDARHALAALGTRPPLCPTCARDRAAPGFWSRIGHAMEEASCPECATLAQKARVPGSDPGAGRDAEGSLVGPAGDR